MGRVLEVSAALWIVVDIVIRLAFYFAWFAAGWWLYVNRGWIL